MILDELSLQKHLDEQSIKLSKTGSFDQILLSSLKQKLDNQVVRCKTLHEALAQQKISFQKTLEGR